MQSDASPGQALHERHLRTFVDGRFMMFFFFENVEDARRSGVAGTTGAHARAGDADAIAIDVGDLIRHADNDENRTCRCKLRLPDKFARLELLH